MAVQEYWHPLLECDPRKDRVWNPDDVDQPPATEEANAEEQAQPQRDEQPVPPPAASSTSAADAIPLQYHCYRRPETMPTFWKGEYLKL